VLEHNNFISADRVEVAPNSIELKESSSITIAEKEAIRLKYDLPTDKILFIYGGNLGKPQGIDFLIKCLDDNKYRKDCYFVIVGNGTEYNKLETWIEGVKSQIKAGDSINVKLIQRLPKEDYDQLVRSCDVGLIFLYYRFTIPNYPSRLLSYLENRMPVLCATDSNTDIGHIAELNGYGYSCESRNVDDFTAILNKMVSKPDVIRKMGDNGFDFLKNNYLVDHTYNSIIKHIQHV
jgi:glycosyltransferase involved in cell wall biosynthesis